ncbi:hypothetical protein C8R44DRAFT_881199 [Mycena epipterygia]|nr:hypothetical protein C8R44DRAFT_881199 [Mycena epipterygia]
MDDPNRRHTFCHESVLNLDLLEEILRHVALADAAGPLAVKRTRRSLLRIALTSRAFSEPALHFLWRKLDNLLPLLKLLPTLKLQEGVRVYSLEGPLAPEDWTAFDRRAANVKEILYDSNIALDRGTIIRLSEHRHPLLPNLSLFTCPGWITQQWQTLLLGAVLTAFAFGTPPDLGLNFKPESPGQPPHLTHLILDGVAFSALSQLPEEFSALEYLELLPRWAPAIPSQRPTLLPRLHSLVIELNARTNIIGPELILPELRHLRIPSGPEAPALRFMQTLSADRVESISIIRAESLDERAYLCKSMCELVAARWAGTLRSFEFNPSHIQDLDPMCICARMEHLALPDCPTFAIDELFGIAGRWTNLISLSVPAAWIDLTSLGRIAEVWSQLLYLEMDLVNPEILPPLSTTRSLAHRLRRLVLHSFPPEADGDAHLLARHFDLLFPRIDSIRYGGRIGIRRPVDGDILPDVRELNVWSEVLDEMFRCQDSRLRR